MDTLHFSNLENVPAGLNQFYREFVDFKNELLAKTTGIQLGALLTRKEAADLLRVSLVTFDEYLDQGKVKGYKIGGKILIKRDEISGFLQEIKNVAA